MKRKFDNFSSAPTSIQSRCSSMIISTVSSPIVKSPSVDTLENHLSRKQLKLTESLINYSKALSTKIPVIAERWSVGDMRLNKIIKTKKEIVSKFKQRVKTSEKIENVQKRVLAAEVCVKQEQNLLNETKQQLKIMQNKWNEYQRIKNNLDSVSNESVRLKERLQTMMAYKEISKKNLCDLETSRKNLEEIEEFYIRKSEEVVEDQEEINRTLELAMTLKGKLEQARNCLVFRENLKLCEELEKDERAYEEIKGRNLMKRKDIMEWRDKIEAKLALMRLENRYVADKRRKISQVLEFINSKQTELKRMVSKSTKSVCKK